MSKVIFYIVLIFFSSVLLANSDISAVEYTHIITCNQAYIRSAPNPDASPLDLLSEHTKVTYVKETFWSEIIPVNNQVLTHKWIFIYYYSKSNSIKYGWIYSGCISPLAGKNTTPKIDQNLYLTNRHMYLINCPMDLDDCSYTCNCDCCSDDYYFLENNKVIRYSYCCCDNPHEYSVGIYTMSKQSVRVEFATNSLDVLDGKVSHHPVKTRAYNFKADICNNNTLYLTCNNGEHMVFGERGGVKKFSTKIKANGIFSKLMNMIK
jgi:hypothetical protein